MVKKPVLDVKDYIFKVDKLPTAKRATSNPVYDSIINNIKNREPGAYKIEVPSLKMKTVYLALKKILKEGKLNNLKLAVREGNLYIVKTSSLHE